MRNAAQPTDEVPTAVGIDAPLYWVAAADRKADQQIRKRLCAAGGRSGTVNHVKKLGDWLVELHDLAGTLALFIPVQVDKQLTQHE